MKFRLSTVLTLTAACLSGVALFWTSQSVQTENAYLRRMESAVKSEKETIRVLEAEWSYLNRPDRLEALSSSYLEMQPVDAEQLLNSPDILADTYTTLIPGRKPGIKGQPVVYIPQQGDASVAQFTKEKPGQARPVQVPKDSFQNLLEDIQAGGQE